MSSLIFVIYVFYSSKLVFNTIDAIPISYLAPITDIPSTNISNHTIIKKNLQMMDANICNESSCYYFICLFWGGMIIFTVLSIAQYCFKYIERYEINKQRLLVKNRNY